MKPASLFGVVPAAGHARRLGSLSHSKEVHPVGGRPVMTHLIARMRRAGVHRIRVITRPEKRDVVEVARREGAEIIKEYPPTLAASFAAGLTDLLEDDVVLLGFPDSLWGPLDGYVRLLAALEDTRVVLGLFSSSEPQRSDVVRVGSQGDVEAVEVKSSNPSTSWLWGCAVARVGALEGLGDHAEPGRFFDVLARTERIRAVRLSGPWLDIGVPEALERAESVAATIQS